MKLEEKKKKVCPALELSLKQIFEADTEMQCLWFFFYFSVWAGQHMKITW